MHAQAHRERRQGVAGMENCLNEADAFFTLRVREIQSNHPHAHQALVNWGLWSRERGGIFPTLALTALWDMAQPGDPNDWAEPPEEIERVEQAEVKAEAANEPMANEKQAAELDAFIHDAEFPAIWRKCLAAAYFRRVPEYQLPREATSLPPHRGRIGDETFLEQLSRALQEIERTRGELWA